MSKSIKYEISYAKQGYWNNLKLLYNWESDGGCMMNDGNNYSVICMQKDRAEGGV